MIRPILSYPYLHVPIPNPTDRRPRLSADRGHHERKHSRANRRVPSSRASRNIPAGVLSAAFRGGITNDDIVLRLGATLLFVSAIAIMSARGLIRVDGDSQKKGNCQRGMDGMMA